MNWSLNWRSPNVFLTWLLLRHNINIFQVSCEGRHDLYTCHPLLNGFYGLRRMWRSACGPGLWPFQVFSQTTSPGSFPALLLFSPFLLPCSGWGHGKRAWGTSSLGLRSHNVPRADWDIPGPWKQGKESSLRRMGGHLEGKAFLLEAPQACHQWSLKPLTIPFFPGFPSSSRRKYDHPQFLNNERNFCLFWSLSMSSSRECLAHSWQSNFPFGCATESMAS